MKKKDDWLLALGVVLCCALLPRACAEDQTVPDAAEPAAIEINSQREIAQEDRIESAAYVFDDTRKNIGMYLDTPEDIRELEEKPDIIGWFEEWYRTPGRSAQKLELCGVEHVAIPFITWEPKDVPLQEIADGVHDEYIEGFFDRIALYCPDSDVLIRFAHEMDFRPVYKEPWYSWQLTENPEIFVAAWRHVVEFGRKLNPNVKWVWSPNRADEYAVPYYPGDEYVDYVGVTSNLPEEYINAYDNFEEFYAVEGLREYLEAYNKKIFISELGYSNQDIDIKINYVKSALEYFKNDPRIVAVVFFNENVSKTRQYKISDNEECMRAIYESLRELKER